MRLFLWSLVNNNKIKNFITNCFHHQFFTLLSRVLKEYFKDFEVIPQKTLFFNFLSGILETVIAILK